MAGRIPSQFIDDLLARTDIVELIGGRMQLRKAGKDFQARCPFHDEKTPSFTVSQEKQFYHCFGCGAHGSAIGFLMEYDRLSFREAIDELAHKAGIEVPSEAAAAPAGPDYAPLYAILDQAAQIFRLQLREHPDASRAIEYLKGRGLSGEIAGRYGLGYAPPGWDLLLTRLGESPAQRERLLQAGLITEQDGKRYDRFRDRVIFPIRDRRGRVIGFGGRVLGDGKPKYLNSPETPVFHKGRELYGLYEVQQARRKLERLLVVEGYMDVIALAQFGIDYAVATLGTATTIDHLQVLLRSAPELVFCFDGDRAGRDAAWKALETALHHDLVTGSQSLCFLFLPDGEDPDTLIRAEGLAAFEQRLVGAQPLDEYLFEHLSAQLDTVSRDGRARLVGLAKPLIKKVTAGIYKA
ncbi:MAG: DNA primase, partial [Lamprocystis purpurea]|nr:DNA primase [Lamprocystis purpurea]